MERDLRLIRSKRAEQDKAEGLLKVRSHDENDTKKVPEKMSEKTVGFGDMSKKLSSVKSSETKITADVVMVDAHTKAATTEPDTKKTTVRLNHPSALGSASGKQEIPQQTKRPQDLAVSQEPNSMYTQPSPPIAFQAQGNTFNMPDQSVETPTTANLRDADFETMFNDTEAAGNDDIIDFDLGFSADANISNDILNEATFENIAMSNEDLAKLTATSNEDINTLLPGLEKHLNAADGFSMMNITASSSFPESSSKADQVTVNALAPSGFDSTVPESNFEDLFSSTNFEEETGDYDMSGDGNIGDIADLEDWFNTEAT